MLITAVLLIMLTACSGEDGSADPGDSAEAGNIAAEGSAASAEEDGASEDQESAAASDEGGTRSSGGGYKVPEFRDAVFNEGAAEGNGDVLVDLSSVSQGYVALHCYTDGKIKFQVIKDALTVTYSVVCGKDQVFPLQSGDGHYEFKVMKNVVDSKYAELYSCSADVVIPDEFDPFLRPSQYADYKKDSQCVQQAASFAGEAADAGDFVNRVYSYIAENVTYDEVKAQSVTSGYLPDPDSTMDEKKGICFDYACLAASMLRSQGGPTKIIFGYVAPDDIYHAWNKFYTEDDGWQLAEFKMRGNDWNRIDITFYANNAGSRFIGDGSNYTEAYEF